MQALFASHVARGIDSQPGAGKPERTLSTTRVVAAAVKMLSVQRDVLALDPSSYKMSVLGPVTPDLAPAMAPPVLWQIKRNDDEHATLPLNPP